jgi:hypothetical protein
MLELRKEDEELLDGVIDMHLHALPCLFKRPFDEIDIAMQARAAGYRGLVLKSIYALNADRIQLVRKVVPGIELFGSIVFNHPVGGLNPHAMRAAIGFGVKVAWLPTVHAKRHVDYFGAPTYPWLASRQSNPPNTQIEPITLLDAAGHLKSEVTQILELAAEANVVIGTGHISSEEIFAVLEKAKEIGFGKVVCTHVGWHATDWSLEDAMRMADLGATLEFTVNPTMPARQQADPRKFAKNILAVGAERCIAASDLGQIDNSHPIDGFRMFLRMLGDAGLSERDIDLVARKNPARLLDLPAQPQVSDAASRAAAMGG